MKNATNWRSIFQKVFIATGCSLLLAAIAVFILITQFESSNKPKAGNFTLYSDSGSFTLSEDAQDKVALLYFGFTRCPDVCPLTMSKLRSMMNELSDQERKEVLVIFVSVDHRSDTPESVSKYATYFGDNFIGLTGNKNEIDDVTQKYHAGYMIEDTEETALGYNVVHSNRVFLINKDGDLVDSMSIQAGYEALLEDVNQLLS